MSFSRDPAVVLQDAIQKGYARVRFQQGKPVLDRELNLLGDQSSPTLLADQYLGNGVPSGNGGFRIGNLNVASNDFTIEAGRCLVAGHEVALAANTTYRTQPNNANVAALPAGASNVYVRAVLRPVTQAEDAALGNTGPGDVGQVTAVRDKADWEVLVSAAPINARDHFLLAVVNTAANTVTDRRRADLTLAAVRDEVSGARGTTASVGARVGVSLADDGALRANVVTGPQLANAAVVRRTIADGAVSVAKLSPAAILDVQVTVPPAPGAGQVAELAVDVESADEHAFHLVSVRYVGPRPAGLPPPVAFVNFFNWTRRTALVKAPGTTQITHRHQILLQNPNNFAITVACKAYRIAET